MDNRIQVITDQLDEQAAAIYGDMIPEYQSGYADYVYQTDKPEIQSRRIKNLNKSFLRLLTEPYFYIQPLFQAAAEEVASWSYPAPYDFYDMAHDAEDMAELLSEENREGRYFQVIHNGAFHGFVNFEPNENDLEIGLGTNPKYVGQGLGRGFMEAIENHVKANFEQTELVLRVAQFNARAIHLYQECGYKIVDEYHQEINGSSFAFVKMTKSLS
ncbi:N-acetyltransferase family protein [Streptococcus caprae]|uniref:GNAT family N-acetyltransferase n=1 Tax=Streptococcus caprae TaxID=1640501 RepID=A0ABV8CVY8_9STRE